ncbi:hypothetical protein [Methyloglobulus sp.]|uniref:hypothetical protein n=1 Tax=Methyloglobulus sp. TaxID=2518622 RepID=UPI003989971F
MHTIELPAEIDQNHQIHLQLPETIKAGKAKVIVMVEDIVQTSKQSALADFLNKLPVKPENQGLSRDEIQQHIQHERQSWNK